MIIADENIDIKIIQALRSSGIEIISIAENYKGISDEDIIFLSKELDSIILTEDKDFGEWIFAHKAKGVSIILLRYKHKETNLIIEILLNLFKDKINQLYHKFTTVSRDKIRIREI